LIFALIDPLAWLTYSLGLVGRNLKMMLATAPLVIGGYVIGLPYGPKGVAFGFSLAMTLWAVPRVAWSVHGTVVSVRDVFVAASKPFCSGIIAAAFTFVAQLFLGQSLSHLARLIFGITIFSATHAVILLYVLRQHGIYSSLLQGLKKSSTIENNVLASV
jgi:PST family polysaccharide transporter